MQRTKRDTYIVFWNLGNRKINLVPPKEKPDETDAVADEISHNLESLVGTAENVAPTAEPKHPTSSATTTKFTNLQFGKNYDRNGGNNQ